MSSSGPAVCRVCGKAHWQRDPHVWADEPKKAKVAELKARIENVQTSPKNVQTISEEMSVQSKNVQTVRQVGLRELGRSLSSQLNDLPFEVTKNGRVIARVVGV